MQYNGKDYALLTLESGTTRAVVTPPLVDVQLCDPSGPAKSVESQEY